MKNKLFSIPLVILSITTILGGCAVFSPCQVSNLKIGQDYKGYGDWGVGNWVGKVYEGETVSCSVDVENTGLFGVGYQGIVTVNGDKATEITISQLDPKENKTISFPLYFPSSGSYDVKVGDNISETVNVIGLKKMELKGERVKKSERDAWYAKYSTDYFILSRVEFSDVLSGSKAIEVMILDSWDQVLWKGVGKTIGESTTYFEVPNILIRGPFIVKIPVSDFWVSGYFWREEEPEPFKGHWESGPHGTREWVWEEPSYNSPYIESSEPAIKWYSIIRAIGKGPVE